LHFHAFCVEGFGLSVNLPQLIPHYQRANFFPARSFATDRQAARVTQGAMALDRRRFAVGLAGFCAFINLYSPQPILPLLTEEFGASAAAISQIMTASTLSVALIAPFTGAASDVLGRKRMIVAALFLVTIPTLLVASASTLSALIAWRFVQGLLLPPIFAVTIAYVGEEFPRREAVGATGIYAAGAALGGFGGRLFTGLFADLIGWRAAFACLALVTLAGAAAIALLLPRERNFHRSDDLATSLRQMLRHLGNVHLLTIFAVGFGVLFNFIATFTYVSFHLAAPPFQLSPTALGAIFVVYLVGSAAAPWAGRAVNRFGRRPAMLGNIAIWVVGVLLTLAPELPMILLGLAICAGCGMFCQAVSTAYVTTSVAAGRSSAVGLYVMSFYIGGSVGAVLGGFAWRVGAWTACVALVIAMQIIVAAIVALTWKRVGARPVDRSLLEPP
jgi:predicted MFS family arabinose efflux permease